MSRETSLSVELGAALPATSEAGVAVGIFADEPRLPEILDGSLRELCERVTAGGEFKGEEETTLLIHAPAGESGGSGGGVRRVLLVGLGSRSDFDAGVMRSAAATAVRAARSARMRAWHFVVPSSNDAAGAVRALAEGAHLGLYENGFYQKKDDDESPRLERLTIVGAGEGGGLSEELERARVVAESVNWARTLTDEPGLSLPPREFARRAAEMAGEFGLTVESLSVEEISARGMGGLLGVGQGSEEEPALIVLRYEPEGATEDEELWAFVGKGITFDTGGISIKHGLDMYEMKSDMAGGAAALGALRAIAQLKPNRRLVAVVPAAENMPSGKSIKPGDIVRTFAGPTIECVDTDAEGRLVLVDGIAYAKHLGATRVVDLATLTGSIIIALGTHRAGLFSNDDAWAAQVLDASLRAGEPAWRMPVSDDYKQRIESMIADYKNYGGKPDATAAALLLSKFAGDTPWVHLDIAGTAWYDAPTTYAPKGASGAGVRTLVELVCGPAKARP
ncbi:MAG: leucyl aminopeptidase [Acidobacteriota bacterium]|jgi:leucyl aminopeptidase|nr:leucyl aminopeptidase [Acidobacteriota bacterium]